MEGVPMRKGATRVDLAGLTFPRIHFPHLLRHVDTIGEPPDPDVIDATDQCSDEEDKEKSDRH
jgi:hypothetical protein